MDSSTSPSSPDPTVATAGSSDTAGLQVDVGILVLHSPGADAERFRPFAEQLATDVAPKLGDTTEIGWRFHAEEPAALPDSASRRPSEFLDEAMHRMVEGMYDIVVVVTDVPLLSPRERYVPGLASPIARSAVISTRTLDGAARERPTGSLEDSAIRWNAATLLLHLVGHILGASHRDAAGGIMEPFRFDPSLETLPRFNVAAERHLNRIASEVPTAEKRLRNRLQRLTFYGSSVLRNPVQILSALLNSRALLLPLSLPKLATAAVTPALVIVFSSEAWDVGFHMADATAALFAAVSIAAAATYLLYVQNLSFPRKQHRVVTEHTALVNVTVFLILLAAMVGLFLLVGSIVLVIQLLVFPPNLMSNWPSLEQPAVGLADLVRTGAFISTIGVLSGALAGGLENREIIRHLALFLSKP